MMDYTMQDHERNQEEIARLMTKIEPSLAGHSRIVITLMAIRLIAAMLGPAQPQTREDTIRRLPDQLRKMLAMMDEVGPPSDA